MHCVSGKLGPTQSQGLQLRSHRGVHPHHEEIRQRVVIGVPDYMGHSEGMPRQAKFGSQVGEMTPPVVAIKI